MSYGLTSTGWSAKSAATIEEELAAAQRASSALGPTWVTSPESVGGQLNAVFAPKIAELWELGGVVFRSRDPRAAGYAGLDAVCSLTGTTRRAATKGTVTLTVTLGAGRTLPAGAVAHVSGQAGNRWVTLTSVTNSSGGTATRTVAAEAESAGVDGAGERLEHRYEQLGSGDVIGGRHGQKVVQVLLRERHGALLFASSMLAAGSQPAQDFPTPIRQMT